MNGLYVVFEGCDGAGKTSTMHKVVETLQSRYPNLDIVLSHHPGSTVLGRHIRKLVKYPHQIDPAIKIDELSRQLLYFVDTVSFIKTVLRPALSANKIVFADRNSFISAMIYGLSDGLNISDVTKLFNIITAPRVDLMYILQCPFDVLKSRINSSRDDNDYFDRKPASFFANIINLYDNLITTNPDITMLVSKVADLENIKHIDATAPQDVIVDKISSDIIKTLMEMRYI